MEERTSQTPGSDSHTALWRVRLRRLFAVVWSYDFLVGVPLGLGLGLLPVRFSQVAEQTSTVLLAVSGIGAALGALVLTSMTVLLSVLGSAYRAMLNRVPGGVVGTLTPYRQVVVVAAAASITSLAAAMTWPAVDQTRGIVRWLTAGVPLALLCWAVLGCVQTVGQMVRHVENNEKAEDLERRTATALAQRERRLAKIEGRGVAGE